MQKIILWRFKNFNIWIIFINTYTVTCCDDDRIHQAGGNIGSCNIQLFTNQYIIRFDDFTALLLFERKWGLSSDHFLAYLKFLIETLIFTANFIHKIPSVYFPFLNLRLDSWYNKKNLTYLFLLTKKEAYL